MNRRTINPIIFLIIALALDVIGVGIFLFAPSPANRESFYNFDGPEGIAVDETNNVFIADTQNNRIIKFDQAGNLVMVVTGGDATSELFTLPRKIALDSKDNFYVVEVAGTRIQKFDKDGQYLGRLGTQLDPNGISLPYRSIAVDKADNLYTTQGGQNQVQVFDSVGKPLWKWQPINNVNSQVVKAGELTLDQQDNVYLYDDGVSALRKFDKQGVLIRKVQLASPTITNTGVGVHSLAVDAKNNVYIVDFNNGLLEKFGQDSKKLGEFNTREGKPEIGSTFGAIDLDKEGNIYLTDRVTNSIQKFDTNGTTVFTWKYEEAFNFWILAAVVMFVISALLFSTWAILANRKKQKGI